MFRGWNIPSNICCYCLKCRYPPNLSYLGAMKPLGDTGSQAGFLSSLGPHPDPLGLVIPSSPQPHERTQVSSVLILDGNRSEAGKGAKHRSFHGFCPPSFCREKETLNNQKLSGRCERDLINHKDHFKAVFAF